MNRRNMLRLIGGTAAFVVGGTPVKYNGASDIALTVRDAVEVPAS